MCSYAYALNMNGDAVAWGINTGQSGSGSGLSGQIDTPMMIDVLDIKDEQDGIKEISCSNNFVFALTNNNNLWGWGFNLRNQLAIGIKDRLQTLVPNIAPKEVSTGQYHTAVIDHRFNLYLFGGNSFGQLGDRTNIFQNFPVLCRGVSNVIMVSCGQQHTMVVTSANDTQILYTFGANTANQLGDGTVKDRNYPNIVFFVNKPNRVVTISAGGTSSIMLLESGSVYICGLWRYKTMERILKNKTIVNVQSGFYTQYLLDVTGDVIVIDELSFVERYSTVVSLNATRIYGTCMMNYLIVETLNGTRAIRAIDGEGAQNIKIQNVDINKVKSIISPDLGNTLFISVNGSLVFYGGDVANNTPIHPSMLVDANFEPKSLYYGAWNTTYLIAKECVSGYSGPFCSNFYCGGLHLNDTNVCSGHGLCLAPNLCSCFDNNKWWHGDNCEYPSEIFLISVILPVICVTFLCVALGFAIICLRAQKLNSKHKAFESLLDDVLVEYKENLLYDTATPLQDVAVDAIKQTDTYFISFDDVIFLDKLGRGQYGVVFRGRYNSTTPVAIKMLTTNVNDSGIADFRQEALTLARIHHPHCVMFVGVTVDNGSRYIITELMHQSLSDVVHMKKKNIVSDVIFSDKESRPTRVIYRTMTMECKLSILLQVSDAMAYLHLKGMIHFDLKPANVLLNKHMDTAKICDFGTTLMTGVSFSGGTLGYMCPELLSGGNSFRATNKVDVYSFAIIMYEMLFERHAYNIVSKKYIEDNVLIKKQRPPLPLDYEHVFSDVELMYVQLMMDCWEEKPQDRPDFKDVYLRLEYMNTQCLDSNSGRQPLAIRPASFSV
ncbi:hypothetical protein AKO1_006096, partial [Acrasis kona]